MRDTRASRSMAVTGLSAAIGAILGTHFLTPILKRMIQ